MDKIRAKIADLSTQLSHIAHCRSHTDENTLKNYGLRGERITCCSVFSRSLICRNLSTEVLLCLAGESRKGSTQCTTWSGLLLQPQCSAHLPLCRAVFVYNRLAVGTDIFSAPSIPPDAKVNGVRKLTADTECKPLYLV